MSDWVRFNLELIDMEKVYRIEVDQRTNAHGNNFHVIIFYDKEGVELHSPLMLRVFSTDSEAIRCFDKLADLLGARELPDILDA